MEGTLTLVSCMEVKPATTRTWILTDATKKLADGSCAWRCSSARRKRQQMMSKWLRFFDTTWRYMVPYVLGKKKIEASTSVLHSCFTSMSKTVKLAGRGNSGTHAHRFSKPYVLEKPAQLSSWHLFTVKTNWSVLHTYTCQRQSLLQMGPV